VWWRQRHGWRLGSGERLPVESKVEGIDPRRAAVRGNLLKAGIDAIQVRNTAGEHSMERSEVVRVKGGGAGAAYPSRADVDGDWGAGGRGNRRGSLPVTAPTKGTAAEYLARGLAAGGSGRSGVFDVSVPDRVQAEVGRRAAEIAFPAAGAGELARFRALLRPRWGLGL